MELTHYYIPNHNLPCFYIGYYQLARVKNDKSVYVHYYHDWSQRYVSIWGGVRLPLIHCADYQIKYDTVCFTMQYSKESDENYISDFLKLYPAFEVSPSIVPDEALIALEYTPKALAWLTEHFGLKIADIPPKAPKGYSRKPLIFFLFTNSSEPTNA